MVMLLSCCNGTRPATTAAEVAGLIRQLAGEISAADAASASRPLLLLQIDIVEDAVLEGAGGVVAAALPQPEAVVKAVLGRGKIIVLALLLRLDRVGAAALLDDVGRVARERGSGAQKGGTDHQSRKELGHHRSPVTEFRRSRFIAGFDSVRYE